VKLVAIWIGSFAIYALAVRLGASEGLAGLIMGVVLAESCISWSHSREVLKREREAIKNTAREKLVSHPNSRRPRF
jgi:NhaP-type Na+/H+ or K+/H+ antiporter